MAIAHFDGQDPAVTRGGPNWTLRDYLRKSREDAGLSHREMADRLGPVLSRMVGREITVKHGAVGSWERGAAKPSHKGLDQMMVLAAWAEITDWPAEWFWDAAMTQLSSDDEEGCQRRLFSVQMPDVQMELALVTPLSSLSSL